MKPRPRPSSPRMASASLSKPAARPAGTHRRVTQVYTRVHRGVHTCTEVCECNCCYACTTAAGGWLAGGVPGFTLCKAGCSGVHHNGQQANSQQMKRVF
jgi:hypothetical protein